MDAITLGFLNFLLKDDNTQVNIVHNWEVYKQGSYNIYGTCHRTFSQLGARLHAKQLERNRNGLEHSPLF